VTTATVRDLRTHFPRLKQAIAREGEILVTERGRPAYVLRAYRAARRPTDGDIDYFARLKARQPRPLSARASRALDEANRGDR
jgi:antitoxin (DNA-binding transcriptional repressor) of toxin-antitoxin stability system